MPRDSDEAGHHTFQRRACTRIPIPPPPPRPPPVGPRPRGWRRRRGRGRGRRRGRRHGRRRHGRGGAPKTALVKYRFEGTIFSVLYLDIRSVFLNHNCMVPTCLRLSSEVDINASVLPRPRHTRITRRCGPLRVEVSYGARAWARPTRTTIPCKLHSRPWFPIPTSSAATPVAVWWRPSVLKSAVGILVCPSGIYGMLYAAPPVAPLLAGLLAGRALVHPEPPIAAPPHHHQICLHAETQPLGEASEVQTRWGRRPLAPDSGTRPRQTMGQRKMMRRRTRRSHHLPLRPRGHS